jgi:hypothetical protein
LHFSPFAFILTFFNYPLIFPYLPLSITFYQFVSSPFSLKNIVRYSFHLSKKGQDEVSSIYRYILHAPLDYFKEDFKTIGKRRGKDNIFKNELNPEKLLN